MKQLLLTFCLGIITSYIHAGILRVNGTNSASTYASIDLAVTQALAGDTIYIEPGYKYTINDFGINIDKKLAIIGNGFRLTQFPNLQAIPTPLLFGGSFTFEQGSDSSYLSLASQSNVAFITIDKASNITVDQSVFAEIYILDSSSNITIKRSWFRGAGSSSQALFSSNSSNINIENCFFSRRINCSTNVNNIKFVNCNFHCINGSSNFDNCLFINNIFLSSTSSTSSLFTFNISPTCQLTNNIFTELSSIQSTADISLPYNFQDVAINDIFQTTSQAAPDSCLLNPTFHNQSVGIFAGDAPFTLAHIPPIPSIYQLELDPYIKSNNLKINLSTRSNK